jgi:hypothetical protein
MSVKATANRFSLDSTLVLRASGLAGVTATTATGSIALDILTSYWASGDDAEPAQFVIETQVESISGTTPTITYHVQVAAASDSAFGSPVEVMVSEAISAVGYTTLALTEEMLNAAIVQLGSIAGFLRVNAVVAGTTPVVAFNAYLAPLVGR